MLTLTPPSGLDVCLTRPAIFCVDPIMDTDKNESVKKICNLKFLLQLKYDSVSLTVTVLLGSSCSCRKAPARSAASIRKQNPGGTLSGKRTFAH